MVLEIGIQVCDGLAYAHAAVDHDGRPMGLIHRDIKPSNLMLSWQGLTKIADFGIARTITLRESTGTDLFKGTLPYMSPEQATGDRDVDPRSDVYALGCVLYELLAGQPPFMAATAQAILVQILTTDAPSITAARRPVLRCTTTSRSPRKGSAPGVAQWRPP